MITCDYNRTFSSCYDQISITSTHTWLQSIGIVNFDRESRHDMNEVSETCETALFLIGGHILELLNII